MTRKLVETVVHCKDCGQTVYASGDMAEAECGCGNVSVINAGGGNGIKVYNGKDSYVDSSIWEETEE